MAGVRVQHATQRSVRFTLTDPTRPFPSGAYQCTPPEFGGCGSFHTHKTHHLNLDETGSAIVEEVLYRQIRPHLMANGFTESNIVAKPPTLSLGLGREVAGRGAWGNIPIIRAVGVNGG